MMFLSRRAGRCALGLSLAAAASLAAPGFAAGADAPTPDVALKYVPTQRGVEVDTPDKGDYAKCEVKVERKGKTSGWAVYGPQGQLLRRFIDTNGDNVVDQWRYYQNGLEVYRDIDTNANNKYDQYRWLNFGGTRWGIDKDEDGKIDSWKVLSAEEASRVAVEAMIAGDYAQLQSVLVSAEELKGLGVGADLTKQLLESVAKPEEQAKAAAAQGGGLLARTTTWMRFDSSGPGLIPADEGKASGDLFVYENAMAIVDPGGGQAGLIQIGEMVRVGDVWKLTQIPKPIAGNVQITPGGILMQPGVVTPDGVPGGIPPAMRELLEALQKLDGEAPKPEDGAEAFARYNAERARILRGLVDASVAPEDKEMWTRQFADSVSAAVQMGIYPEGLKALESLEKELNDQKADASLRSYVTYRRVLADYSLRGRSAQAEDRVKVQQWWLEQLKAFVDAFPKSPDAAEALLQLALAEEVNNEDPEAAAKWYGKLAQEHADTPQGLQAAGAVRRLGLKGKPFALAGPGLKGGNVSAEDFKGKVLLVLYWSTGCVPCEQELPLIRALYEEYKGQGFEILGVNLDVNSQPVGPYIAKHKITWPQIHEPGGLESPPAQEYGVVLQPTMILVGRDGKVISRSTTVADLRESLPGLLKGSGGE